MKVKISIFLCVLLLVLTVGCQKTPILKPAPVAIPSDAKLICIFFDDAYKNQFDVALPVLLQYNFKATFAVITDYIGKGRDLMEYMDAGELEALARDGMDIASHSKTHARLTSLSYEELRVEISESKQDLENMGFEVSTMVYPYYEWDDRVIDYVIAANYTCARCGWTQSGLFNRTTNDPRAKYHIEAWQISNQDMNGFKLIVNKGGRNTVVCLVYHLISDDGPEATSTPLANFLEQMAYLKSAGYTVVPLPDIFRQ
ncbi:MAG: polysaccharide deacetylase family protein, partial [Dehalococcoidales bacterium]